jgi:NYN domain/OST-HTH/LOTUS domain
LSKYGTANIRRAYGDWTGTQMKGWREKLHEFAIRPIQQFSYSSGKNATDIALVIDAMELLYTQKLDAFCIVSSDGDFTPLVMQLRANGHEVFGFGARKTPEPFVNACTTFLYLEGLSPSSPDEIVFSEQKATSSLKADTLQTSKPSVVPKAKPLAQDTREDGWALLSLVGAAVKRQAPIDHRNYGVKTFSALIDATGLFEIYRSKSGQTYISDKRNSERSKVPAN